VIEDSDVKKNFSKNENTDRVDYENSVKNFSSENENTKWSCCLLPFRAAGLPKFFFQFPAAFRFALPFSVWLAPADPRFVDLGAEV